ncbi:MAG: glutaredoxin [Burkholderiales bacterium]
MVKVEVFYLPGCSRCITGLDELEGLVTSFGPGVFAWGKLDLLQNIDYAVKLGVLSSPAMAIDGKLAFASLPTPKQLRAALGKFVSA